MSLDRLIPPQTFKQDQGFTLIEVIIALSIVATVLVLLATAASSNVERIRKTEMIHKATSLLQQKMLEFEVKYRGKAGGEIAESEDGDFGDKFPGYRWTFESREFTMPNMEAILISQEGGADEMLLMMVRQMGEYIEKSVKEGKVTVFVKGNKKTKSGKQVERKFTLTTYFVDYEANVPLGMGGQ